MATQYDDPNGKAAGQSAEKTNSKTDLAGLYRHPVSGAEIITIYDPLYGDAQSEGVIRVGFVRISDAPEGSIKYVGMVPESPQGNSTDAAINRLADVLAGKTVAPAETPAAPVAETPAVVPGQLDGIDGSTGTDAPIAAVETPAPAEAPVATETPAVETPVSDQAPAAEGTPAEESTETPATETAENKPAQA